MEDYRAILDDMSRELLNWMKRCELVERQYSELALTVVEDFGPAADALYRHQAERESLDMEQASKVK